jgi:hypothetical protein
MSGSLEFLIERWEGIGFSNQTNFDGLVLVRERSSGPPERLPARRSARWMSAP